jgi:prepilin-type N-terminal cleavage/methylation domain-containing protein
MKSRQSGFTLVEIAIVLVIIGLLLGGVLKGQELINNARIKGIVNDLNSLSAATNSYLDRYHALPGDELAAAYTARWGAGIVPGATAANGVLAIAIGATFTTPAAGEGAGFWQSLRAAQMITGAPTDPALPTNAQGGLIGVNGVATYGQSAPTVCVSAIPTKIAGGVDSMIDGPAPAVGMPNSTGTVRANTGAAAILNPAAAVPPATAYNETATTTKWTMCKPL